MYNQFFAFPNRSLTGLSLLMVLTGCGAEQNAEPSSVIAGDPSDSVQLAKVLAAQTESVQARYPARHPAETLTFFGIRPGMTVVETDPGSGWYTNILRAYLGDEGTLIGADYALDMYPLFEYYSDEELVDKAAWASRWPGEIAADREGANVLAYNLGSLPVEMNGTVDTFLFVRSMHNLYDFEAEGGFLSTAIDEAFRVLKPGGVVGIVQHMGPETHSDEWASGANGYLKRSAVIAVMEAGGFVLDGESDINLNPADQPSEEEYVWRLPPTSEEVGDAALAASYLAIGESNRMTLRFTKPSEAQ